jgi:thiol-disulfide isomerase/thioredoxin
MAQFMQQFDRMQASQQQAQNFA